MRCAARLLVLLAPALPVLASPGGQPGAFTHALKPGGIAEDCVRLKAGQSREFSWTADAPVDFNIHWHLGDKIEYPVRMDRQRKGRGRFSADREQDFCWMWTAPKEKGATVQGRFGPVE
jgi:hypothetical protein